MLTAKQSKCGNEESIYKKKKYQYYENHISNNISDVIGNIMRRLSIFGIFSSSELTYMNKYKLTSLKHQLEIEKEER